MSGHQTSTCTDSHEPKPSQRAFTWNDPNGAAAEEDYALQHRPRRQYIVSRPKVIQYAYKGQIVRSTTEDSGNDHAVQDIDEAMVKSRERLDLFIDLIWVGIVSNISEAFSTEALASHDASVSKAFPLFLVVFLPSWRIWNGIREILNNYYRDDLFQRLFIFWLLVLSIFLGNNLAYTTETPNKAKITSTTIYLCIRASILSCEVVYSIFIPWLRRIVLLEVLLYLPSIGLWIGAMYLKDAKAYGPIVAAIILDYIIPIILDLAITRKRLLGGYGKALDTDHFTSRMGSFFIITIGEGVLQLVREGPLGIGVTRASSYAIWGLLIYFVLTLLYFNRDSSQTFVPAVVRKGWRTWLWISWHIPIFMSALTLSAGIMYTVRETAAILDIETAATKADDVPTTLEEAAHLASTAVWTIAISLAVIVLSMTAMALLDQPRDSIPLRISNRYLRLAGRPIYALIVLCVAIPTHIKLEIFLGICGLLLGLVTVWEYIASTELGNKIVEPKSTVGSP